MNTLAARLAKINETLDAAKIELAEWEKMNPRIPDVRRGKSALIEAIIRLKYTKVILTNMLENKRADLQAREFEAMNRYERGLN